jgi:PAS domain S-box-containing protein
MGVIQSLYLRLFAKLRASRLRAEPALRERERRFRQVVEAAPNAMVMIGRAGEIVMVNAQAERAFGYARAELVGQPVEMLVPERFRARHPELRQTFFFDPKPRPMGAGRDLYGVRKDGSEFPVEIGLNPIETDGETMVVSAIVDITQRKAADLALRERELARTNRLMHMFALTASIANEVNQPITAVVVSASAGLHWLAAQPPDLESVRQTLKTIIQEGKRAGEVTGRIGALVKQAPARTDRLNINDVIREALAMAQPELQKNRVELHNRLLSGLPVVLADRVQLQQVLLNLVSNAIEAMTRVGESARELAVISGGGDAAGVFVEVRDSGPGLDQAQLERLFDPFYTTKPEGLGMGLAVSRSIIEAHGGRLWAEPNQPGGAAFRFTLPVAEETSTDPVPSEA